jgi:hypothetical protein
MLFKDLDRDPRLMVVARQLRKSYSDALGYHVALMLWAGRYAQDGVVRSAQPEVLIEGVVDWKGKAGLLVAAFIEHGLLSAVDGGLKLADWAEQQGAHIEKLEKERERDRTRKAGTFPPDSQGEPGNLPRESQKVPAGFPRDSRGKVSGVPAESQGIPTGERGERREEIKDRQSDGRATPSIPTPSSAPSTAPQANPSPQPAPAPAPAVAKEPPQLARTSTNASTPLLAPTPADLDPLESLRLSWNSAVEGTPITAVPELPANVKALARERLKECPDVAVWAEVFRRVCASPWFHGRNKDGRVASLGWVLKSPEVRLKAMAGDYVVWKTPAQAIPPEPETRPSCSVAECSREVLPRGEVWGVKLCQPHACEATADDGPGPKVWLQTRGLLPPQKGIQ